MSRILMILPPAIFAVLGATFFFGLSRENPTDIPSAYIGAQAPALGTQGLAGYPTFTAADLARGDVTVVNFWASWCPPCRAEHPTLTDLAASGVRVFGVNMMDDAGDAQTFLADAGNPFAAIIADPRGKMRLDWGVSAPPETFILRGDGSVAYRFIGPIVGDDYEQRFLPELEKARAAE